MIHFLMKDCKVLPIYNYILFKEILGENTIKLNKQEMMLWSKFPK